MDRHSRQVRLAGVGAEGQARIAAACADVGLEDLAGEVAVRYLAGAGVGRLRVASQALAASAREVDARVCVEVDQAVTTRLAPAPSLPLRDPVALAMARGALLALGAVRSALERAP